MKYFLMIAVMLTMSISETICVTLPNGNIICTNSNGDNTYIYSVRNN